MVPDSELTQPMRPLKYRLRAAPWLVGLCLLASLGCLAVTYHFQDRVGYGKEPDRDGSLQGYLKGSGAMTERFEEGIAPTLDAAIAGDRFQPAAIVFIGNTYPSPTDDPSMLISADDVRGSLENDGAPALTPLWQLMWEWDDRMIAALSRDGTAVLHPDLLIDARDADYTARFRTVEAQVRSAAARQLAAERRSYRLAEIGRVVAPIVMLMLWIAAIVLWSAGLRRVDREKDEYRQALERWSTRADAPTC